MRAKLILASLLFIVAFQAHAQVGCDTPASAKATETAALARSYDFALGAARLCLGSAKGDDAAVVARINSETPDVKDVRSRKKNLQTALKILEEYARAHADAGPNKEQWTIVRGKLVDEMNTLETIEEFTSPSTAFLATTFWPDPRSPGGVVAGGAIALLAPTGCAAPPAACAEYEPRKDLIRAFNLVHRLGVYAETDKLALQLKDANLQTARWKTYFNDTRPQYWWEIIANGRAMKKKYCDEDPNTSIQLGFCRVPDSQLIVMHPAAALQWVNGANNQQDLRPAFIVEVFGRNSWNWKDSTASRQHGWALLAAYSNRGAEQKKWSYGLMLHYGKDMNVGLTTTSKSEFGVLVSARLAGRFFEQRQKYLDYLMAKEKPGALDLLD